MGLSQKKMADAALKMLEVDELGLDEMDKKLNPDDHRVLQRRSRLD